jgi:hypothetical protein
MEAAPFPQGCHQVHYPCVGQNTPMKLLDDMIALRCQLSRRRLRLLLHVRNGQAVIRSPFHHPLRRRLMHPLVDLELFAA